ncbi:glycosyltransferase family A protein [Flavobacterium tistrianum]|uniref:glycosyltransferase family A protein n=1 Tax=Flavobacterium tistrianum TaxID=1685414 RepID=UPI000DAC3EA1|nr:glycosyltransferase family 2 protein [Flavobacterium tistrianum]KAF2342042.1 glycosyltransferase family 2 protein [Flavobacterium tistrianum]
MAIKVSLVVSTYGRYEELKELFDSLLKQDYSRENFEVILIDQNDVINLSSLTDLYKNDLILNHYKTDVKGLSKAKNKGIELARGELITFPDDDCTFYPNTISSALTFFEENPTADIVFGSVWYGDLYKNNQFDVENKLLKLNSFNFSFYYSAITCFTRIKSIRFDENYGVGSRISSGEELDYVINSINSNYNVYYYSLIQVWHPILGVSTMPNEKVYKYAYGYASIIRKNLNFSLFVLFLFSLFYQVLRFILNIHKESSRKYLLAISGRLDGFFKNEIKYI